MGQFVRAKELEFVVLRRLGRLVAWKRRGVSIVPGFIHGNEVSLGVDRIGQTILKDIFEFGLRI